jgi:hypothetical protein
MKGARFPAEKAIAGSPFERSWNLYVSLAILIGFVSAVLAGMFGIGGAATTTPSIRLFLGASPAIALGTTLPVTIPTSASAAITYWRRGLVDSRVALLCCSIGVAGAAAGAFLTRYVDLHYLMFATGAMVLYISVMTIKRGIWPSPTLVDIDEAPVADHGAPPPEESLGDGCAPSSPEGAPSTTPAECVPSAGKALMIGLGAGLLSGLLGVGGGVLLIPGFLYILRMPIRRAFATSLAVIAVIAIPGTVVHALLHHISWSLALYLAIGSIPGAYLGARLNLRTAERLLYIMFGALLGIFGVLFIVNEIISMTR